MDQERDELVDLLVESTRSTPFPYTRESALNQARGVGDNRLLNLVITLDKARAAAAGAPPAALPPAEPPPQYVRSCQLFAGLRLFGGGFVWF